VLRNKEKRKYETNMYNTYTQGDDKIHASSIRYLYNKQFNRMKIDFLLEYNPVLLALLATLFTWGITALGSSMVFFFKIQCLVLPQE
jgi:hypothetical protein